MDAMAVLLAMLTGLLAGSVGLWLLVKGRLARLEAVELEAGELRVAAARQSAECARLAATEEEVRRLEAELEARAEQVRALELAERERDSELRHARQSLDDQKELLVEAEKKMVDVFKSVGGDVLKQNMEELARQYKETGGRDLEHRRQAIEQLVKPLSEALTKYEEHISQFDKEAHGRAATMSRLLDDLKDQVDKNRQAALDLKALLRGPTQRGRVGEMLFEVTLQRAGLIKGQNYEMQPNATQGRPDCHIFLPDDMLMVLDSKTPLNAYQEAMEADDEGIRLRKLEEHAKTLRQTVLNLSSKSYREANGDPAQIIMYLPFEASLAAAQAVDPQIASFGWDKRVIIATPTLLFTLMVGVARSWRFEQLRRSTNEVAELGREMVDRVRIVAEHLSKLGAGLRVAVNSYDETVSSFERNLFTSAMRFQKLGVIPDKPMSLPPEVRMPETDIRKPELLAKPNPQALVLIEQRNLQLELGMGGGPEPDDSGPRIALTNGRH